MWEAWLEMAKESQQAALGVESISKRSALSRHYYASYQAVTALLHYLGQIPPIDRDGWNHQDTPAMILDHLRDNNTRRNVSGFLRKLYRYRIFADYTPNQEFTDTNLSEARKMSGYIVKVAQEMIG